MADRFFTAKECDRCGGSLEAGRKMSRFDTSVLCMRCIEEEKKHPDYPKAAAAELEARARALFPRDPRYSAESR